MKNIFEENSLETIEICLLGKEMSFHGDFFSTYERLNSKKGAQVRIINHEFIHSNLNSDAEDEVSLINEGSDYKLDFLPIFSFYNNHSSDFTKDECQQTRKWLEQKGAICLPSSHGKENALIIHGQDRKVGILFLCAPETVASSRNLTNSFIENSWKTRYYLAEQLRQVCDFTILYIHWGNEYLSLPCHEQIVSATNFCNYFNLIVGHHSHIPQVVCDFHSCKVYFGLGNYCFDDLTSLNNNLAINVQWLEINRQSFIINFDTNNFMHYRIKQKCSLIFELYFFCISLFSIFSWNIARLMNIKLRSLFCRLRLKILN